MIAYFNPPWGLSCTSPSRCLHVHLLPLWTHANMCTQYAGSKPSPQRWHKWSSAALVDLYDSSERLASTKHCSCRCHDHRRRRRHHHRVKPDFRRGQPGDVNVDRFLVEGPTAWHDSQLVIANQARMSWSSLFSRWPESFRWKGRP